MIADIGTRPVFDVSLVNACSIWINGFQYMALDEASLPFQTVHEIKLTGDEIETVQEESL